MAGASGKKLDETYKLAWLRGLKTTYYLRTLGATHAEKSTVASGQLNAVSNSAEVDASVRGVAVAAHAIEAASVARFCAIDNPECEACQ
jgi:ribonucleoside-diphosphate reductase alpha chain